MDKGADLKLEVSPIGVQSITSNIRFSTQDEGTAKLAFFLFKDGVELPLNAVTGKLVMRMADGSKFTETVTIVDKLNGIAEYWLTKEQLKHFGRVNAELYLNYDNNQKMSVHRFSFVIEQALIDADIAVDTEFYVDDFYTMKETIETIAAETKTNVDATKEKADEIISLIDQNNVVKLPDYEENKQQVNAQLATMMTQAEFDSWVATLLDGGPSIFFDTYTQLVTTHPNGAAGVALVRETDPSRLYVWNGEIWKDYGAYQGIELKDKVVTRAKLSDELQNKIIEEWEDNRIIYGLADKEGHCVFSIDQTGTVTIHKLELTNDLEFKINSIKQISLENHEEVSSDISGVIWGIVDSTGKMSELVLGEDGRVPEWVMEEWAKRLRLKQTAIENFQEVNSEASGIIWGITDSEGRMSELVLDEAGQVPNFTLDKWKERMNVQEAENKKGKKKSIGDSLTAGAGGNGTTYSNVLANLLGEEVLNFGVGGETSATIACRQGGRNFVVNNITIPATTTKVEIANYNNPLKDNHGRAVFPLRQGSGGINPCYINGIKGTLSATQTSSTSNDIVYYFTRENAGEEEAINRPTAIVTNLQMIKDPDDVNIIFIGQNGGYDDDTEHINQVKSMIDFSGSEKYVVLGLTSGSAAERAEKEKAFIQAFGRKYINLREYLSAYGVYDAEITPTEADLAEMAQGKVPPSLRVDGVHFNAAGYTVIANVIYKRFKELLYI